MAVLWMISGSNAVLTVAGSLILYKVALIVHRLYFHPLARFPGPRWAAASYTYQFYYDVIQYGTMIWQLERLHDVYGPVVRFTPNEIHVKDPDFYNEMYNPKLKLSKPVGWNIGASHATISAVDHEQHKLLRSAMNPFFSKRNITLNENQIKEKLGRLIERLKECKANNEIVPIDSAYMALTMDIITTFAFNVDHENLSHPDFNTQWRQAILAVLGNITFLQLCPWVFPILNGLPLWMVETLKPSLALTVKWQLFINDQVDDVLKKNASGERVEGTIFQAILDSNLPAVEKRRIRLEEEGNVVVGAGSETTARTLSIITYFLCEDRVKLTKLRKELRMISAEDNGFYELGKLEQLPYLTACITEGLRYMTYAGGRFPRVSKEPIDYKQWTIPPGALFSVNIMTLHANGEIFSKPLEYIPDRWLKTETRDTSYDKYYTPFGKGPRSCIGVNLAWAELYLTLAHIVMKFDFELYETTWERDVKIAHDNFIGVASKETKGIRLKVVDVL